jgi:hypothetical protein
MESFLASLPGSSGTPSSLQKVAASSSPVLILGEPGTGRSVFARLVHKASPRASSPLVELDPAALPAALLESELFGYRAGAFTGAERSQVGRVARAEGGTLVLDHFDERPLSSQPILLRLLAEHRYSPLGGAEIAADVRFVAIGAHDLPSRVERGAFRPDLYFRLEVLTFVLPCCAAPGEFGARRGILADPAMLPPRSRFAPSASQWMLATLAGPAAQERPRARYAARRGEPPRPAPEEEGRWSADPGPAGASPS